MDTRIISIGVDVGGTNTDAVLLNGNELIAKHKTTTTSDITTGIITAIKALFDSCQHLKKEVKSVNIGTTHLLNALLQRQGLAKPLVIRLAAPYSSALPPAIDWPEGLQEQLIEHTYIEDGGYEFDATEIRPLDIKRLTKLAAEAAARKTFSVAITGLFSNVNPFQEEEAGQIFRAADPLMNVSLSHNLGELGLLARENATILNACLTEQHQKVGKAFKLAMDHLGLEAQVFLTYGDGTKSNLEDDSSTPLRTLNSGPINSIKGAAVLANISDAVTVDIGGTSSDVGLLRQGEPANESSRFKIGGINCNFTSARLNSFALGGGTIINIDQNGNIHLGPASVGKDFADKALVFGGDILTPTDIAVALGRLNIGTLRDGALKQKISQFSQGEDTDALIKKIDKALHAKLAEGIKEIVDSIENIPATLVLIGGGAALFDFNVYPELIPPQMTKITIPSGADVANAFGAAKSLIGARCVQIYSYDNLTQTEKTSEARVYAISQATETAKKLAIFRGADPSTLKLSTMSEIHFNYLPGNYNQISLAMVGEDSGKSIFTSSSQAPVFPLQNSKSENSRLKLEKNVKNDEVFTLESPLQWNNLKILTVEDIDDIALGAGLLGSGGGGNPEMGRLLVRLAVKTGKEVRLVPREDLPDSALTVTCGLVGSPVIGYEKLFCIEESIEAVRQIEKQMHQS